MDDIALFQRLQLERIYENSKQAKDNSLTSYLGVLKANTELRLNQNKSYQDFVIQIKKEEPDTENLEKTGLTDYQLQEGLDLIKDLIFMNNAKANAA